MAIAAPARAQGTAVLTGKIKDAATNKGVADVVVTLTSKALQGEQIVTTDASGSYRIPSLPPGDYELHLDKEGYRAYQRNQIQLRADATIRLDAELLPDGFVAPVVVIKPIAPVVDMGSSSTGTSINEDFVLRVPVTNPGAHGGAQRTFESVAEAAPGANADQYGTSIGGATSPENAYVVDGVRTNSAKYGINGSPLSIEFIKEVNVLSGGYMPEYGRSTGGILNVVTKSGSNEFHGSAWANWTPGALEGKRKYPYFTGTAIQTRRSLGNIYDIGFDQSGPIVKDKLWYYVGFGVSRAIYNLDRSIWATAYNPDGTVAGTSEIGGTNKQYKATATSYQIFAKLDYRINSSNKLALTFAATPTMAGGGGDYGVNPTTGLVEGASTREFNLFGTYGAQAHTYQSGAFDTVLKWTTDFDNKSKIVETTLGWHHEVGGVLPADGFDVGSGLGYSAIPHVWYRRTNPSPHSLTDFENVAGCGTATVTGSDGKPKTLPTCPVPEYRAGGADFINKQVMDVYSFKSVGTVLAQALGHHVIKAGVDVELLTSWWSRGYTGGMRWREATDGSSFLAHRAYGYLQGPDQPVEVDRWVTRTYSLNVGGFLQDSWQLFDKVTLNAGVRYDNQLMFGSDGKMLMTLPNQISPRLGLIFDPTQAGRSKLFVNYARFYESVPLNLLDRQTGETQLQQSVDPAKCNPLDPAQASGVCRTDAARVRAGAAAGSTPDRKYATIGGGKGVIDPDISPQSSSEIVAGGEYEIVKNGRFGLTYTRRWMNNVIEDMSNDEGATYFIGNPGKGIGKAFPEATRNYDAGTAYFMKNFSDNWLAQVSYTLSWLRGNVAGLYDPTTGQLDPNINGTYDLKSLLVNQTGDLPGDRRHSFKVFGAKDFAITSDSTVQVGGSFQASSGRPTNFLGGHRTYGTDLIYILPRGTGDRLPWTYNFGAHLGYQVRFGGGMTLAFTMDVFNLFNFQGEMSRDQRYTSADTRAIPNGTRADLPNNVRGQDGTPFSPSSINPNFGRADYYQEPRQFRFGIRGSF
ncbi:TonB-dependent receptor [Pendulispora brunnea]|uniref:TonB-dependent receptor n=1 Tax=Pendulispora brunnea TaxID=2905690 RepID=A0ABZ2KFE5_9BACT